MSTLSFALRDSATMLRRDVRRSLRNLSMTLSGLLVPIIMLLLFVYVFGGAISAGLGGAYIDYLAPGIIILTVGSGGATTALNLCADMNEGIITRFRTMAIFRASVLTGQVLGSLIRTMISVGLVTLVALVMGFRPTANPVDWIAALGVIALFTFALTWMAVVFGLVGPELRKVLWRREVDNSGTVWRKGELDHANSSSYRSGFQLMWYSTGRVPGVTSPKTALIIDPGRRLCQAQPDQGYYLHCGSKASILTLGLLDG